MHYGLRTRSALRARLRFRLDRWCASRSRLFIPFSHWVGESLIEDCGVPRERVHSVNVGVDLELWPYHPREALHPPKILFVGGSFLRKGGDLLVDVFARRFAGRAELHLVTTESPSQLPCGVVVHKGLAPNDARLRQLFAEAALVALPTRSDMVPQVILEAMSSGAPVVATTVGGIPDLVRDGETGFLIPPDDGTALGERIEMILGDPDLGRRMGAAGRRRAESEFSAEVNVPRILWLMKHAVDAARAGAGGRS